jgi:hypothetical protein
MLTCTTRADRAAYVSYDGNGQTANRWHVGGNEEHTYRPGI